MSLYNASDEASAPATPSTGRKVLYPKSDGWYYTDSTGTEYQIADTTSLFRLNDIINGQFRIAQAGTSFAAPASGAYDLDGWRNSNNTSAVFTVAQATGSSTGKLCRTVTVTTALASVAAADYVLQQMRLEGYDCVKYLGNDFIIGFAE